MILKTQWPEPVWAIPNLLPAGLAILAGAPKMGKSWLSLQFAAAVGAGGMALGRRCGLGTCLYCALEDSPRRLQDRMKKQLWPAGVLCDFLTVGRFQDEIGDLRNGGGRKLANYIEAKEYKLVVIDTLSRALGGDQNDVAEMTEWLTPLQEMAQELNTAIILVDHHKKMGSGTQDTIADILGSTAKGAMADTVIGLYRERGQPGAKLNITGREIEEMTLNIRMDWQTGCWQLDDNPLTGLTGDQADLVITLEEIGPSTLQQICEALGKDFTKSKGTLYNRLVGLQAKNRVYRSGDLWALVPSESES